MLINKGKTQSLLFQAKSYLINVTGIRAICGSKKTATRLDGKLVAGVILLKTILGEKQPCADEKPEVNRL